MGALPSLTALCWQAKDGGQLESTSVIDNYPGFENGVDAVEMVQNLQKQAERFGAKFKTCEIVDVELLCRPFKVTCAGGDVMTSSSIIIATGAGAKWLGVPGIGPPLQHSHQYGSLRI